MWTSLRQPTLFRKGQSTKVRCGADAATSTRDACATQRNAAMIKELAEHERFLKSLGGMGRNPRKAFGDRADGA